jgi:hypothetical protein
MKQEELINVFKYIVKKCDMLINNGDYKADAFTQDIVEDVAELCNHIIDGDYGKLAEVKEVDLEKEMNDYFVSIELQENEYISESTFRLIAKHFFELGLKASQKG